MEVPGRPTPQRSPSDGRPRFEDRAPEDYRRSDINPYVASHRTFGRPLLTATDAAGWFDRWDECFGRSAPLHLEIGSGNGFFLTGLCLAHPDWNVLGIELRYKRTVQTAQKLVDAGARNGLIARYHAAFLDDLFTDASLEGIYVNHPDPWPKERHEKNRLISRWFLGDVARLLVPGGHFRLKSDFRPNVDRVAELLAGSALPLCVTGRSDDVIVGRAPWADDIETNYQRKMRERGQPVYAIEVVRTDGPALPARAGHDDCPAPEP